MICSRPKPNTVFLTRMSSEDSAQVNMRVLPCGVQCLIPTVFLFNYDMICWSHKSPALNRVFTVVLGVKSAILRNTINLYTMDDMTITRANHTCVHRSDGILVMWASGPFPLSTHASPLCISYHGTRRCSVF